MSVCAIAGCQDPIGTGEILLQDGSFFEACDDHYRVVQRQTATNVRWHALKSLVEAPKVKVTPEDIRELMRSETVTSAVEYLQSLDLPIELEDCIKGLPEAIDQTIAASHDLECRF